MVEKMVDSLDLLVARSVAVMVAVMVAPMAASTVDVLAAQLDLLAVM